MITKAELSAENAKLRKKLQDLYWHPCFDPHCIRQAILFRKTGGSADAFVHYWVALCGRSKDEVEARLRKLGVIE